MPKETLITLSILPSLPHGGDKGEGSLILSDLIADAKKKGKTVILETAPPIDDISVSRQHFYERMGMVIYHFPHKHPPYRKEFLPHSLRIMSANQKVSGKLYDQFARDLNDVVM